MHWLEVEQNKEQYLRYLIVTDRLRLEASRLAYLSKIDFAFILMSVYQLFPDRIDEIDRHWTYYKGHLVTGL